MSAAPEDTDSVLRLAAEIYSPFDARETRRLREYVESVEDLVESAFFKHGKNTVTLSAEAGGPLMSTIDYPGEEAVRAVVGLFRQLYNHHEPTSYNSVLKLLGHHVNERDSAHREAAVAELRALRVWEKEALRPTMQLIWQHTRTDGTVEEEELTPAVLIDLFLHGRYLHRGNEKSDKLDAWPMAHLAQQSFFGAMMTLSQVYWVGANVVREILKVPALLDTSGPFG
jgi:hypothetical protein